MLKLQPKTTITSVSAVMKILLHEQQYVWH